MYTRARALRLKDARDWIASSVLRMADGARKVRPSDVPRVVVWLYKGLRAWLRSLDVDRREKCLSIDELIDFVELGPDAFTASVSVSVSVSISKGAETEELEQGERIEDSQLERRARVGKAFQALMPPRTPPELQIPP